MLPDSFGLLAVAVLLGGVLAVLHLRATAGGVPPAGGGLSTAPSATPPPGGPGWQLGALHGLIGATGLVLLLLALGGPPRGVSLGVGAFGLVAAVLLALALLVGLAVLVAFRLRRRPGALIALHATLAVSGFVILAAYVFLG
jgi:hypothetical protein